MKTIILTLLLSLPLVGGGVLLPIEEGYAMGDRGECSERRTDRRKGGGRERRKVRRAYAAGAVASHRRHERHERRERYERYERRENRRDAARAAVAIGAAAAIIGAASNQRYVDPD